MCVETLEGSLQSGQIDDDVVSKYYSTVYLLVTSLVVVLGLTSLVSIIIAVQ